MRRLYVLALYSLSTLVLASAVSAGDFVTDGTTIPDKVDYRPLPTGADPLRYWRSTDANEHRDALNALRTHTSGVVNVKSHHASGSSTATTGSISFGSNLLTVASAIDFEVEQGISVAGAGAAGALLVTSVTAINGTILTLAASAGTTVSGAAVNHDDTAAIEAAEAAAKTANKPLGFPAGTYKHAGLNYDGGVPWIGFGIDQTVLNYTGSTIGIDAVGTDPARKPLSIRDMTLNGSASTGTAIGLRLGWNQRSFGALVRVKITNHASWGIYFADDNWQISFSDVYVAQNGRLANGGIGIAANKHHNAITWHHLEVEANGKNPLTIAGGIDLDCTTDKCVTVGFYGLLLQGNAGLAEARLLNVAALTVSGLYGESDLAAGPGGGADGSGGATDGLILGGTTNGTVSAPSLAAVATHGGKALRCIGSSKINLAAPWIHPTNWTTGISAEDTALVTITAEGRYDHPLTAPPNTVASGAAVLRQSPRLVALTDAATITVDASKGTVFYVTLGGNRTMGAPTNPSTGQRITFIIYQDATGGRTLSWTAPDYKLVWSDTGNIASTASTVSFIFDSSRWRQEGAQSPYSG